MALWHGTGSTPSLPNGSQPNPQPAWCRLSRLLKFFESARHDPPVPMRSLVIHAIGAFSGLGVDAPSTMGCLLTKVSVRSELSLRGGTTMGAAIVY